MKQNGIVELRIAESIEELEKKIKHHKYIVWKNISFIGIIVILMVVGTFLLFNVQIYSGAKIINSYAEESTEYTKYVEFLDGFLKYGRDGAVLINEKSNEIWNQPYQIKNPIVEICNKTAVIGDNGGTQILVFDKNGLKGEIKTTLPIEKLAVSSQGIVVALLRDDTSPKIICYDSVGNTLVEHDAYMKSTGYPIDVSISKDGYMLLVTYIYMKEDSYLTKVAYYELGKTKENENGREDTILPVSISEYENIIMPTTFYMKEYYSVVIGDRTILIYAGAKEPKLTKEVSLDKEIKSVVYTDNHIGLVLKNSKKNGYELRVYNVHGKQVMSKEFVGEYSNVEMNHNEIILYEGPRCSIYTLNGVNKFQGEIEGSIGSIVPIMGLNKYVMMNAKGLHEVRLVK